MDWASIGGWIVAVLLGGLKAFEYFGSRTSVNRKTNSEADESVGKAWATLYGEVRTRLAVVEAQNAAQAIEMGEMKANSAKRDTRLAELERKMAIWLLGIRKLIDQIVGLGHVPVWSPDEDGH